MNINNKKILEKLKGMELSENDYLVFFNKEKNQGRTVIESELSKKFDSEISNWLMNRINKAAAKGSIDISRLDDYLVRNNKEIILKKYISAQFKILLSKKIDELETGNLYIMENQFMESENAFSNIKNALKDIDVKEIRIKELINDNEMQNLFLSTIFNKSCDLAIFINKYSRIFFRYNLRLIVNGFQNIDSTNISELHNLENKNLLNDLIKEREVFQCMEIIKKDEDISRLLNYVFFDKKHVFNEGYYFERMCNKNYEDIVKSIDAALYLSSNKSGVDVINSISDDIFKSIILAFGLSDNTVKIFLSTLKKLKSTDFLGLNPLKYISFINGLIIHNENELLNNEYYSLIKDMILELYMAKHGQQQLCLIFQPENVHILPFKIKKIELAKKLLNEKKIDLSSEVIVTTFRVPETIVDLLSSGVTYSLSHLALESLTINLENNFYIFNFKSKRKLNQNIDFNSFVFDYFTSKPIENANIEDYLSSFVHFYNSLVNKFIIENSLTEKTNDIDKVKKKI